MGLKDIALWQEQDWITAIAVAVLGFFLLGGAYIATRKEPEFAGHPRGLYVLFFAEMWERFSYYGMRALLIMFFTASIAEGGWQWEKGHAMAIFGTYTSLVYISTLLGGYFADKVVGYRYAVLIGALLMTFGHAAMAVESPFFIYTGLVLLVFGSGFFKPNI